MDTRKVTLTMNHLRIEVQDDRIILRIPDETFVPGVRKDLDLLAKFVDRLSSSKIPCQVGRRNVIRGSGTEPDTVTFTLAQPESGK